MVLVGASTGGPPALDALLSSCRRAFPGRSWSPSTCRRPSPAPLARRLDGSARSRWSRSPADAAVEPGHVYVGARRRRPDRRPSRRQAAGDGGAGIAGTIAGIRASTGWCDSAIACRPAAAARRRADDRHGQRRRGGDDRAARERRPHHRRSRGDAPSSGACPANWSNAAAPTTSSRRSTITGRLARRSVPWR